jgi:hypothetical protein
MNRVLGHLRSNVVAYVAVGLALGASGGYAIASTGTKTIQACVVKSSGELLVRTRCSSSETKLAWNQAGPQGVPGKTGAPGAPGQAPASAWAIVSNAGVAEPTDGIAVQHVSTGTYQITVTAPACSGKQNAPVVTVSDANPPAGQNTGAFPVAWIEDAGSSPFTVYTGVVVTGTFTPTDHTFNVQDICG